MTGKDKTPEQPDKPEESAPSSESDMMDLGDESTQDSPVLLDDEVDDETGDLLELEDFPEGIAESEDVAEIFPPDPGDHVAEPEPMDQAVLPGEARSASPWSMVLGGLVAGAIGFGAAYLLNPAMRGQSDQVQQALAKAESNATELGELAGQVETLRGSLPEEPDLSGLEQGVADINARVSEVSTGLAAVSDAVKAAEAQSALGQSELTSSFDELRARVATLEVEGGNPGSAQGDAAAEELAAFRAELEALVSDAEARIVAAEEKAQAILAEAQAAAEATEAEAVRRAELARKQAALAELRTAVDAGASYQELVAALDDVPSVLKEHAKGGVPTMVALQQAFPPAARSALATAQTVPEDASAGQRFTAFLRRQTNARSLAPKEGSDPDAVLSRAEAYLAEGKLGETLSEVSALPEDAQAAMSGWLTDAQTRQAVLRAVDALSANLN